MDTAPGTRAASASPPISPLNAQGHQGIPPLPSPPLGHDGGGEGSSSSSSISSSSSSSRGPSPVYSLRARRTPSYLRGESCNWTWHFNFARIPSIVPSPHAYPYPFLRSPLLLVFPSSLPPFFVRRSAQTTMTRTRTTTLLQSLVVAAVVVDGGHDVSHAVTTRGLRQWAVGVVAPKPSEMARSARALRR